MVIVLEELLQWTGKKATHTLPEREMKYKRKNVDLHV